MFRGRGASTRLVIEVMAHEHVRKQPPSPLACIVSIVLLAPLAALEEHEGPWPGDQTLTVRVLGVEDTPLDGARVEMWRDVRQDGLLEKGCATQRAVGRDLGEGEYRFTLPPPGVYRLRVAAPGHGQICVEAIVNGSEPITVQLEAERPVRGVVLDVAGKPIEGAEILAGVFLHALDPLSETRSDASGSFTLHGLSEEDVDVCVSADGFICEDRERVRTGRAELVFRLSPAHPLLGRVVAEDDGLPVANAEVEVSCIRRPLAGTRTDWQGFFRLTRLPARNASGRISHEDFTPLCLRRRDFEAARSAGNIVLGLRRGLGISGHLRDARTGAPVGDATILIWPSRGSEVCHGRRVKTGPDGSFQLQRFCPGTWQIRARKMGYVETRTSLVLDGGALARELSLWFERGGSVAGRVLDSRGMPVETAQVTPVLASISGEESCRVLVEQTVATDAGGRFLVEGIPHGSLCHLVASRWDLAPTWHESIELPPTGRASSIEIRLSGWGALEGSVPGHPGTLLLVKRGLPPCLEDDYDARNLLESFTMTDESDAFTVDRVAPGPHRLQLRLENGDVLDAGRVLVREGETFSIEAFVDR